MSFKTAKASAWIMGRLKDAGGAGLPYARLEQLAAETAVVEVIAYLDEALGELVENAQVEEKNRTYTLLRHFDIPERDKPRDPLPPEKKAVAPAAPPIKTLADVANRHAPADPDPIPPINHDQGETDMAKKRKNAAAPTQTPFRFIDALRKHGQPVSVKEAADLAEVSEPTARKMLKHLVKEKLASTVGSGRGTKYKPNGAGSQISNAVIGAAERHLITVYESAQNGLQAYIDAKLGEDPDYLFLIGAVKKASKELHGYRSGSATE